MDTPVETQEISTLSKVPKYLEVVRIPTSGVRLRLEKVPLVNVDPGDINEDECKDFERKLGHIPDLRSYTNSKNFSWAHRSLVGASAKLVPTYWDEDWTSTWKRDYMMYLCLDKEAGLLPNQYLNKTLDDSSGGRGARQNLVVYGDSFVFKKEPKLKDSNVFERAEYIHMDQTFVDGAKYGSYGSIILQDLLRLSIEGDVDDLI